MNPVLQALILADRVYEDKATGKKIISGTFNKLMFSRRPLKQMPTTPGQPNPAPFLPPGGTSSGSPSVYISLTDLRGKVPLVLRYVLLDEDREFFRYDLNVENSDPLRTVELVLPLPTLPTPRAGVYAIELLCNETPLGALRVIVEDISPPDPDSNDEGNSSDDEP